MLFDDAQSYTTFKSGCRLSQSVISFTPEYSLVSSAKLTSLDADTSLSISEIIIKNRRGCSSLIPPEIVHHAPYRQISNMGIILSKTSNRADRQEQPGLNPC